MNIWNKRGKTKSRKHIEYFLTNNNKPNRYTYIQPNYIHTGIHPFQMNPQLSYNPPKSRNWIAALPHGQGWKMPTWILKCINNCNNHLKLHVSILNSFVKLLAAKNMLYGVKHSWVPTNLHVLLVVLAQTSPCCF